VILGDVNVVYDVDGVVVLVSVAVDGVNGVVGGGGV
jgi:hypothetical protein